MSNEKSVLKDNQKNTDYGFTFCTNEFRTDNGSFKYTVSGWGANKKEARKEALDQINLMIKHTERECEEPS